MNGGQEQKEQERRGIRTEGQEQREQVQKEEGTRLTGTRAKRSRRTVD
jgi:hypothetical protein